MMRRFAGLKIFDEKPWLGWQVGRDTWPPGSGSRFLRKSHAAAHAAGMCYAGWTVVIVRKFPTRKIHVFNPSTMPVMPDPQRGWEREDGYGA